MLCSRSDAMIEYCLLQMSEACVGSDVSRFELFSKLLEQSERSEQLQSLAQLLQVWPPLDAFK